MCGIAGFIDYKKQSMATTLHEMTDVLHHRGPDDSGYSYFINSHETIGLGHRRLSVLDLSEKGHQPMHFHNIEIIYNGEIYNFKEIRSELEKYEYSFDSESDTEVILKAYHKWGIKSIEKFNGMFAICIYDIVKNKIFLIRDRVGIKPLYWYWKDDLLLFASELKSFHKNPFFNKEININSLSLYLKYGYILQPHTIFNDTHKLKSGHYLEVDLTSKKIKEIEFWSVYDYFNKPKLSMSSQEVSDEFKRLFKMSFESRMLADVPVGLFLSGGYDSSALAAILQSDRTNKLNTFTIGFHQNDFNEAPFAKEVALHLGTNHNESYCGQKEALDIIPSLAEIYDEPFADSSAIPTILVSKIARKNVTVVLSADGSDEIFAGYNKYLRALKYLEFLKKSNTVKYVLKKSLPLFIRSKVIGEQNTKQMERVYETLIKKDHESILKLMLYWNDHHIDKLLLGNTKNITTFFDDNTKILDSNDEINKMLAIDLKTYLVDDILNKVDRATMSVGLEGREPFLDHKIIEFSAQLSSTFKLNKNSKKAILKDIVHQYIPKSHMDRPKMGFGVPLHVWFKNELKELISYYLAPARLEKENIFKIEEIELLKWKYFKHSTDENIVHNIWKVIMFEMWYEKWM